MSFVVIALTRIVLVQFAFLQNAGSLLHIYNLQENPESRPQINRISCAVPAFQRRHPERGPFVAEEGSASFRMQRCVLLDEIGHCLRLILDDVVHAVADQPGLDMSASVCAETFCNLWNQLCKR